MMDVAFYFESEESYGLGLGRRMSLCNFGNDILCDILGHNLLHEEFGIDFCRESYEFIHQDGVIGIDVASTDGNNGDSGSGIAQGRFNTIITSLKALDESFSSRNHVRKSLRALPTKWRPKITAIEESKDLSTLLLDELIDELIGNLKVYEVVLEKDLEISKVKKEKYKSLARKARKVSSDEEISCSKSYDEEYATAEDKKEKEDRRCFKCGDPNHFISDCPTHSYNDQKAFVVGCWSDSEDDSKKKEVCLIEIDNNERTSQFNRTELALYRSLQIDDDKIFNLVDLHVYMLCRGWKWQDLLRLALVDHRRSCGYGGAERRIHDDSFCNEDLVKDLRLIEVKGFNSKPYLVGLIKQ
nr:hypothetical protein [Tanacetum cinerariifolium]